ncbi:esterase-like activity of phytase family protein [Defluviimonas sp. WL0002]|uniref:Esterase-like activity of phytase family protein n=1 Tax=Albidovulum marisflavi TaxID=2984159 RepID=A0ABT2Z7K4_9RHOB|nr:esterase-like activity of phytase family protein [Defluviimonas sp. WL0002]MCV2867081.1 esterase-like activity of phytase family protein [Defluviimonas sp. WL0002]
MSRRLLPLASLLAMSVGSAAHAEMNFNRIASFATALNNGDRAAETSSAEIIAASDDGMTLIYTDSPLGVVGLIDIADATTPQPRGNIDVGGEPTSVTVIGNTAYVAVNTSKSYVEPSGKLVAIDLGAASIIAECDLGGQPDSTAHDDAGSFVAVAIENERDEDAGDGRLGQMPAGYMIKAMLKDGSLDCAVMERIEVTGLAAIAPEDPEPEFVDVNGLGEIAGTLQENNHIVVIGADGQVLSHFPAGAVDLEGIDATDERAALTFTERQPGRLREPDGLQWIDNDHFMIANEGDMDGGSRSITVFAKDGTLVWESGNAFETPIIQAGHYPDKRSDAKGVEPEGMEIARFGDRTYAFVLSERSSTVSVYDVTDPANPAFKQVLPSGISPEGVIAIPGRNLFATANEVDLIEDGGARSHVMLYEYQEAPAAYPTLTSEGGDELIGWGAISGLVAGEDGLIYAVNDSFYGFQPRIFVIDPAQTPARILRAIDVTRGGHPAQKLDIEGITTDGDGGFWLASEGRIDRLIPHALYHVNAKGEIKQEVAFPAELLAHETRFGAEGITRTEDGTLWVAIQRNWGDDAGNDVKLLNYAPETGEWGAVTYPTEDPENGWVGLSEITAHGGYLYLIERDNQIGNAARVKQITRVALEGLAPAPLGETLPVVQKELVRDMIPDLAAWHGYTVDKIEGLAIQTDGTAWVVSDNDGVDDSSGETFFWSPGRF